MRVLITTTVLLEVEDAEELAPIVERMEESVRLNYLSALEQHGATSEDIADSFAYFGVSACPEREAAAT